ncbi:MAG TPA: type II CAAX endopeptidase family protein [Terriglobia bacterium]|nr:type II CAAX endopeptidase family protein [Terriglobia bacterium]
MNSEFDLPTYDSSQTAPGGPAPAKPFPVWSGWDVILLISFAGFSAIFLGAFGGAASHILQLKVPAFKLLPRPASEGVFLVCYQAVLDILILMFIYFTITLKYNSPFFPSIKWLNHDRPYFLVFFPMGVLLAFVVLGVSVLVPTPVKPPIEELLKHPVTAVLFAALGVFLAPFVEEVIFRGFIYPVVERRGGKVLAVVLTALLFTGLHVSQLWGSWIGIVLILFVGLTLSTVRAKTDSLVPSFVIHFSYNSTIAALFAIGALVKGLPE